MSIIHDERTFYKNEKVRITDGYFTNGIYKGSVINTEGIIRTHIITSMKDGKIYPNRWVSSYYVDKLISSPTNIKHIYIELVKSGQCLAEWASSQGY